MNPQDTEPRGPTGRTPLRLAGYGVGLLCVAYFALWACLRDDELPLTTTTTTVISVPTVATVGGALTSEAQATYVEANADAIARDISLGSGPTINDFARQLDLDPGTVVELGRRLREKRRELQPMLERSTLNRDQALRFTHALRRLCEDLPRKLPAAPG